MIRLMTLILATCMVGEAGYTVQIEHQAIEYIPVCDQYQETVDEPETDASEDGWTFLGSQRVTGYTWTGNTMANGVYPSYGWCACNGLPLGSVVYVEGLGYFTVGDRGGMTDPYWIDIYFDTVEECYNVTGYYDIYVVGD